MALSELNVKLGLQTKAFDSEIRGVQRKLGRFQRDISKVGGSITASVTAPLAAAGAAGIKLAVDLETNFSKIKNLVGVADEQLSKFSTGIVGISSNVARSQQELSEALFTITSAGKRGDSALKILESSARASTIGLGETNTIAKAVTATITAYGEDVLDAARATDILAATVREGNLEASALAPSLGDVIGIAAQLGVSFEQVGASIATLTRLGTGPEEAITGLTGLLSGLIKPTDQGSKALAQIGLSYQDLRESIRDEGLAVTLIGLTKAFDGNDEALSAVIPNIRALKTVLGTAGVQGDDYVQILNSIETSTGLVDKGFENVSKGSAFQFKQALVDLKNIGIDIGKILLPVALDVTKAFRGMLERLQALSPETKKNLVNFGLMAASVGPVLLGLSKLVGVASSLVGGFKLIVSTATLVPKILIALSNPVVLLTGAFSTLTKGLALMQTALAPIAPLLAVVGAAVAVGVSAYKDYSKAIQRNIDVTENLADINKIATESIAIERAEIAKITENLNDSNEGYKARVSAIQELQQLNPTYFAGLNTEESSIQDITDAMYEYLEAIQKRAKVIAAQEKLVEIEKQLLDVQTRIANNGPSLAQSALNIASAFGSLGSASEFAIKQGETAAANLKAETDALKKQRDELTALIATRDKDVESRLTANATPFIAPIISATTIGASPASASGESATSTPDITIPAIESFGRLNAIVEAGQSLMKQWGITSTTSMDNITGKVDLLGKSYQVMTEKISAAELAMINFNESLLSALTSGAAATFTGIGEALGGLVSSVGNAGDSLKSAVSPLVGVLEQVGKLAIQTGIATLGIKLALESLNPVAAIAGGIALVALAKFTKSKLAASVPKLAEGGVIPPGFPNDTFPALLSSGETVIPLDRLQQFNGGGSQVFIPDLRIDGENFVVAFRKAETKMARYR